MARKHNPWMDHMAKVRKQYPNLHFTEVAKKAKETYHSPKKGGAAMGGDLSPTAVHGLHGSSVDLDTQVATQYSGGKKSRKCKSRKAKKSRRSKSKSCKRR